MRPAPKTTFLAALGTLRPPAWALHPVPGKNPLFACFPTWISR